MSDFISFLRAYNSLSQEEKNELVLMTDGQNNLDKELVLKLSKKITGFCPEIDNLINSELSGKPDEFFDEDDDFWEDYDNDYDDDCEDDEDWEMYSLVN